MSHTRYHQLILERPELFTMNHSNAPLQLILDEKEICDLEQTLGYSLGVMYEDDYIFLLRDGVIFPDGQKGSYIRIFPKHTSEDVVVLPLLSGKLLLMSHYRHSLQKNLWEFPRGIGETGSSALENAERELFEETNITNAKMHFLGKICADSGLLSTSVAIFLAEITDDISLKNNDSKETIHKYQLFSMQELQTLLATESILDAFTLSAISLALSKGFLHF